MKKIKNITCYVLAFVLALLTIYLFLYVKMGKYYMAFEQGTYCVNDIMNEVKGKSYNINDYDIYLDNERVLSDTEKDKFNSCTLKYIPRYKAVYKSLLEESSFFLRAFDDDLELLHFYHTIGGTYVELAHFGEKPWNVKYALFDVEDVDLSELYEGEIENAYIQLHTYQNIYYGMSNLTIFILSLAVIAVYEIITYNILRKIRNKK